MGTWMEPGWVPEWEPGWELEWEPDWEAGWEPDWEPGWELEWEPNWDPGLVRHWSGTGDPKSAGCGGIESETGELVTANRHRG